MVCKTFFFVSFWQLDVIAMFLLSIKHQLNFNHRQISLYNIWVLVSESGMGDVLAIRDNSALQFFHVQAM